MNINLKRNQSGINLWGLLLGGVLVSLLIYSFSSIKQASAMNIPSGGGFGATYLGASLAQDLSITKSHAGDWGIGETGIYTITVSNSGADEVLGSITVEDDLPAGLTPVQVNGPGWDSCGFSGQLVSCVFANTDGLPAGGQLPSIILSTMVGEAAAPLVTNTVTLDNANDTNLANNHSDDAATVISADLALEMSVTPTVPAELEPVTYTLQLINNGPSPASSVIVTDTLPAGILFVSSTTTVGAYTQASGEWAIGALAPGEIVTLTLQASVSAGTRGLTITNQTDGLNADQFDYDASNNQAEAQLRVRSTRLIGLVSDAPSGDVLSGVEVRLTDSLSHVYSSTTAANGWYTFTETITEPLSAGSASISISKDGYISQGHSITIQADEDNQLDIQLDTTDLIVTKSDGQSSLIPGDVLTYTLAITNVGTITATNVIITDLLSAHLSYITDTLGLTYTNPTMGTFVWILEEDLGVQEGIAFDLQVQSSAALPSASAIVTNTMMASTSSVEANLANNVATDSDSAEGSPDIGITLSVNPNQVNKGRSTLYTIKVTNDGDAPVTDVVIEDTFSTYLNISATTDKGTATTNNSTRKVTVELDVLDVDETVTVKVTATVNSTLFFNRTVANSAKVTYTFGGQSFSINSSSVTLKMLATSTLPGTGGVEPDLLDDAPGGQAVTLAKIFAFFLLSLGLAGFFYALYARLRQPVWAAWALKMGGLMLASAAVFMLAAYGLRAISQQSIPLSSGVQHGQVADVTPGRLLKTPRHIPVIVSGLEAQEPETLPDYPIPSPTLETDDQARADALDQSPVERIVIPALGVDTVVKYVPFEGLTWLIGGLKQEVAWMGDTSWPGLGGNTALAGHVTLRDGSDGPFRRLDLLSPEDEVLVYTQENIYQYRVRATRVVAETDFSVLDKRNSSILTLITCTGWDPQTRFYQDRLVVTAGLDRVSPLESQLDN